MIRNEIKRRGMTIKAVSARTGVKYQSLQRFTSGRGLVSAFDYIKLCRFLRLDPLGHGVPGVNGGLDFSDHKAKRRR